MDNKKFDKESIKLDANRFVYSLKELSQAKVGKGVFIQKYDFIDEGYRTSITDQSISAT